MKARKRLKSEANGTGNTKRPSNSVTNIDELQWKEVSLPDHLEDYEGFFGLEEIDHVEVVKDESSGRVFYHSNTENPKSMQAKGNYQATQNDEKDNDDEPEWSGFDQEVAVPKEAHTKPKEESQSKNLQKIVSRKLPKPKETSSKSNPRKSQIAESGFKALAEAPSESESDISAWMGLKLSPDTLASLAKMGFSKPTPIQEAVIPEALAGHDIIGKASTGSGKTLAFGIPIFERFLEQRALRGDKAAGSEPLALIMSPTRELAHQLSDHFTALCAGISFNAPKIATLTGGLSLQKQQRLLKDADFVIGTPGRLWEVISQGQGVMAALKQIQFLVIDEADRLLSEGHFKEVEEILEALDRVDETGSEKTPSAKVKNSSSEDNPFTRQTLVFSATFDKSMQRKLAGKGKWDNNLLSNKESAEYLLSKLNFRELAPKFIDVNPVNQLATGLKEGLVECGAMEKDLYLYALLLLHPNLKILVFSNSISSVRRLTPLLQNLDLPALALHSGMPQKARLRSVERFGQAKSSGFLPSSVLIATDVAARGLDIPDVHLIIHYHLPRAADTYVHRSGRTARAGHKGSSILICAPEEVAGVRKLAAKVHSRSASALDENSSEATKQGYYIRTLDIDRRVVSRLKPRVTLAKKLADANSAKEKKHKEDEFMRSAAEELGVDYDSEEFEQQGTGKRGRGSGRAKKDRAARDLTRAELGTMKAELKDLLKQRVNVGISERYLASGRVDIDELLRQQDAGNGKTGEFLGTVSGLGLDGD